MLDRAALAQCGRRRATACRPLPRLPAQALIERNGKILDVRAIRAAEVQRDVVDRQIVLGRRSTAALRLAA